MSPLLFLHLFSLGIWFGCVLVEAVIEIAGARNSFLTPIVARLHDPIDRWVEAPAFLLVLATGLGMMRPEHLQGWFGIKVLLGSWAILVNVYCVAAVIRRKKAVERGDGASVGRYSRQVYRSFALGLPPGLVALAIGLRSLGIF